MFPKQRTIRVTETKEREKAQVDYLVKIDAEENGSYKPGAVECLFENIVNCLTTSGPLSCERKVFTTDGQFDLRIQSLSTVAYEKGVRVSKQQFAVVRKMKGYEYPVLNGTIQPIST